MLSWLRGADEQGSSPSAPQRPRYYLGSAWARTNWDLASKPEEWASIRDSVGYHNHPMGWHGQAQANGYGDMLLSRFPKHFYTLESDLHDTINTSLRENPVAFGENLRGVGPDWECVAFMPWVRADRMVTEPDLQLALYKEVFDKARARGFHENYIFFAPPSGEALAHFQALRETRRDGLPLWIWMAKEAGAVGVAIDSPAEHWDLLPDLHPLSIQVAKSCRMHGLKFVWMLNGTSTREQTRKLAADVKREKLKVHFWVVDHHDNRSPEYPGTPDTIESVAGQMKVLVDGKY